jgi:hypothetical protein
MRGLLLVVLVVLTGLSPGVPVAPAAAPVDVEPEARPRNDVESLLARVREVARGEEWQKEGWKDASIERWLENAVAAATAATKGQVAGALPVAFGDVKVGGNPNVAGGNAVVVRGGGGPVRQHTGALVVASGAFEADHAHKSIVLVDGNARIGFANDCVIVARGAAYVAHGRRNVIVAGHFIHVSHDGQGRPVRPAPGARPPVPMRMQVDLPGSLLISGSTVDVSHARGSTIVAPELVRVSHAHQCAFVNSPDRQVGDRGGANVLVSDELPDVGPPPHPLHREAEVKWVVPKQAVIFTHDEKRYVAEVGREIVDESGRPVPDLAGWTVSFADEDFVLFTNDGVDVGFVVARPQR